MKRREVPQEVSDAEAIRDEAASLHLKLRVRAAMTHETAAAEVASLVGAERDSDDPDLEKIRALFDSLEWWVPREEQSR